jgi:hypothetical protein
MSGTTFTLDQLYGDDSPSVVDSTAIQTGTIPPFGNANARKYKTDGSYKDEAGLARIALTDAGEKGKPAAKNVFSLDELYEGAKPAKPPSEASLVVQDLGKNALGVAREIATVGDMILDTPTSIVGLMGNAKYRLSKMLSGESRKEIAKGAHEAQLEIEKTAPGLLKKAVNLFAPKDDPNNPTTIENFMQDILGMSDRTFNKVESDTKGVILGDDLRMARDVLLNRLGAEPFRMGAKAYLNKQAKADQAKPYETGLQPPTAAEAVAARTVTPEGGLRAAIDQATGVAAMAARTRKQRAQAKADAEAAFKDPAAEYNINKVNEDIRQAEAAATRETRLREAEGVAAPRTGGAEPILLTPEGKVATDVVGQRSLDTGLAKVAEGKAFDLTAAEKVAIRDNAKNWGGAIQKGAATPEFLAVLATAGVGAALVMAYPDKVEDMAGNVAQGLFVAGSLGAMKKLPDATPLAAILPHSDTTLKTLERLPQNKSVLTKQQVQEALARPDVSKAEKDVMQQVLDSVPGDTITPKDLVVGFKEATGDWELKKAPTDEYADYGLDAIDRAESDKAPGGFDLDEATPVELAAMERGENIHPLQAETHVWQLPEHMPMDSGNHFGDELYFGHTRVFQENGVRHVVEIQSDLAQKAKKVLSSEQTKALQEEARETNIQASALDRLVVDIHNGKASEHSDVRNRLRELGGFAKELAETAKPEDLVYKVERLYKQTELRLDEIRSSLASTAAGTQLGPMLKGWDKRLVREELADAARERKATETQLAQYEAAQRRDPEGGYENVIEPLKEKLAAPQMVRFATADTVAKVEGWPNQRSRLEEQVALLRQAIDGRSGWLSGESPEFRRQFQENDKATLEVAEKQLAEMKDSFFPEHQGIYDRYAKDVEKFLKQLGGKEITDSAGHTWIEVPFTPNMRRTQMFGHSSTEALTLVAGVGLGVAVGAAADDLRGAIYGALVGGVLGTAGGRAALAKAISSPDKALGVISTRLGDIAPPLKRLVRDHEMTVLKNLEKSNNAILPFMEKVDKLKGAEADAVALAVYNRRPDLLPPEVRKVFPGVQKLLGEFETELKSLGRFGEGLSDYFPRVVKDLEGLKAKLGQNYAEGIDAALVKAEAKMIRKEGRGLSEIERSIVVNRYLAAPDAPAATQPGYAKPRAIPEVTQDLLPFYEPPNTSLLRYTSAAVSDIAMAKFFGKDLATSKKQGRHFTDIDTSIGNLTARLLEQKAITPAQAMELREMLKARFEGGEKGMNEVFAATRNVTNAALLGQVSSAATQIGDTLMVAYHYGVVPAVKGTVQKIIGKSKVTPQDLGLVNHVAEELADKGLSGKVLQAVLTASGFKAIDMFAKGVSLNAALAEARGQLKSTRGEAVFREKYGKVYEGDIDALVTELKAGKRTDLVDSYLFSRLSDTQPISKAEMPQLYLENPNGRMLYQLKTYMIKQIDVVRRDVFQEIRSGDPKRVARGVKNLLALTTMYALANVPADMVKDMLSGRPIKLPDSVALIENIAQTFGFNRYNNEKLSQGKIVETGTQMITPPLRVLEDLALGRERAVAYTPLIGRPLYDREFGGNEKREIAENRAKKKQGNGKPLSPEAKAYLQRKKNERREKELKRLKQRLKEE